MRKSLFHSFVYFFLLYLPLSAQQPTETIKGKVVNVKTKKPLPGANIIIISTQMGAATNEQGEFVIFDVPVGAYNVKFQYIGFENLVKSDVIVRPGRTTFLNAELYESVIKGETVTVTAAYFQKEEDTPVSAVNFNHEEIRRSPGSAGDISRIINALPGVTQVSDISNDLMVRGGSPNENGYYVDNIPLPTINHFPIQGASGGGIGILNIDFIENVNFYAGGFSPAYGDRLSSIMEITLREGNRDEYDGQIDLNMSGFGAIAEGPLPGAKGSWFFSGKRSYLDLIQDAIRAGGMAPRFGDIQSKIAYDLNSQHKITGLFIFAPSSLNVDRDWAKENGRLLYKTANFYQTTGGVNWRWLWSKKGYSNTSFSYYQVNGDDVNRNIYTDEKKITNNYLEWTSTFRNTNFYQFNKSNKIKFGFEAKYESGDYDYFFAADTNRLGNFMPELKVNDVYHFEKASVFVSYIWNPFSHLTTTFGLRGDYSHHNDEFNLSPRFSSSYKISERTSVNGTIGVFYQSIPLFLLSQNEANASLKNPMSFQYILGLDHMLTADTKMTIELYNKEYKNFPSSPDNPILFIIDEGRSFKRWGKYGNLNDIGKAYSRGIDLLIQKKLAFDFYGLISASYFRSRYKDYNGVWRNRMFDNQYLLSIIGGYKPNIIWEFSIRWNFAGGTPYTPFDNAKSTALNTEVIDQTKINAERYPNYHSLNFRVDRRFHFQKSSIVAYLSVWNLYNRQNVFTYFWNKVENKQDTRYQWGFLPLIGIEYEF